MTYEHQQSISFLTWNLLCLQVRGKKIQQFGLSVERMISVHGDPGAIDLEIYQEAMLIETQEAVGTPVFAAHSMVHKE